MACLECRRRRIKCDNLRPICRSCSRLSKSCSYTEERKRGPKKRNIGELEQRLASLESQLKSTNHATESPFSVGFDTSGYDFSMPDAGEMPFAWTVGFFPTAETDGTLDETPSLDITPPLNDDSISEGFILPDITVMDELTTVYFDFVHPRAPIIHEGRFRRDLLRESSEKPPLCLRFIMWAQAAMLTERYRELSKDLYEKARSALHNDEMHGKTTSSFLTLRHVQAWSMVGTHEATMAVSSRAYLSSKRAVALASMLGIWALGHGLPTKTYYHTLRQPDDFSEEEEQRRTFWSIFIADIWATGSMGFGGRLNFKDVRAPLPCSAQAFTSGIPEQSQTLTDVMKCGFQTGTTAYTGTIVATTLMGRQMANFQTVQNGEAFKNLDDYWQKHDELDSDISHLFMSLPQTLRSPVDDPGAFFLNMLLQELVISVHRTAITVLEQINPPDIDNISKSRARVQRAAVEIVDLMRLASSTIDPRRMMPWTSSALYISATALISVAKQGDGQNTAKCHQQIAFLITAIKSLTKFALGSQLFLEHLDRDLRSHGLDSLLEISENAIQNGRSAVDLLELGKEGNKHLFAGIMPRLAEAVNPVAKLDSY